MNCAEYVVFVSLLFLADTFQIVRYPGVSFPSFEIIAGTLLCVLPSISSKIRLTIGCCKVRCSASGLSPCLKESNIAVILSPLMEYCVTPVSFLSIFPFSLRAYKSINSSSQTGRGLNLISPALSLFISSSSKTGNAPSVDLYSFSLPLISYNQLSLAKSNLLGSSNDCRYK